MSRGEALNEVFSNIADEDARKKVAEKLSGRGEGLKVQIEERENLERERKEVLSQRIAEFRSLFEERRVRQEQTVSDLQKLQSELDNKRHGTFIKLLEYLKIKRLEKEIVLKKQEAGSLQDDFNQAHDLLSDLEGEYNDDGVLKEIEGTILAFEEEVSAQAQEFLEDKKVRDIRNVCAEHNALIVHTINPSKSRQEQVSPLRDKGEGIGFREKLKIILGLQPDISTSSLRLPRGEQTFTDDTYSSLFGVVLKEGSIKQASSQDSVSTVSGLGREAADYSGEGKDIKADIGVAVDGKRTSGSYNEIVVQRPEAAGIFISYYNGSTGRTRSGGEYIGDVVETAKELNLPLYLREADTNRFYEATFDENTGRVNKGRELTPEEIMNSGSSVGEGAREKMRQEIFVDCPFNLDMPERHGVDSYLAGRKMYETYLSLPADLADDKRRKILAQPYDGHKGWIALNTGTAPVYSAKKECRDLSSYLDGLEEALDQDDEMFASFSRSIPELNKLRDAYTKNEKARQLYQAGGHRDSPDFIKYFSFLNQSERKMSEEEKDRDWESFLKERTRLSSHQYEELSFKIDQNRVAYENRRLRFSLMLEGVRSAAIEHGDTETTGRVEKLQKKLDERANTVEDEEKRKLVLQESHNEVLTRRLGPNKEFRITPGDLKNIKSEI